ncbi:ORF11 [Lymantria xylina nucleopolyhedrovirus]|uniref:ORF11 n=1 Tax=Lymantria xylina multiple nucleopolyhedrovirus TaxID=2847840 RepID=D4N248_9ABAC|nr:ORF11 [Lymantria xylina nucleopolyhedrovirus]ADD73720.1 ORF11 [Lymantria xylina nucleopolyhedrovirus]
MKRLYNYNLFILQAQTNTTFIIYNIISLFYNARSAQTNTIFIISNKYNTLYPIGTNKK